MPFLTRSQLAARWGCSVRSVDRRRQAGLLPWTDLAAGYGGRPMVRFELSEIEVFEERVRLNPKVGAEQC